MNKKFTTTLAAVLLCCGGLADATPILNSHTTAATPAATLSNWEFIWSSDRFKPGIGMIADLDGIIDSFQVVFNGMNVDRSVPVSNWISSYAGAKYRFAAIDLETFIVDTYYTSIGKGSSYDPWTDTHSNDRISFPGVGLELYHVSSIPEPGPVTLLAAGIIAIGLTGKRREKSR